MEGGINIDSIGREERRERQRKLGRGRQNEIGRWREIERRKEGGRQTHNGRWREREEERDTQRQLQTYKLDIESREYFGFLLKQMY